MKEINKMYSVNETVGASGPACLLACGSICLLTVEVGGVVIASAATIL